MIPFYSRRFPAVMLSVLLALALLTGCGKKETTYTAHANGQDITVTVHAESDIVSQIDMAITVALADLGITPEQIAAQSEAELKDTVAAVFAGAFGDAAGVAVSARMDDTTAIVTITMDYTAIDFANSEISYAFPGAAELEDGKISFAAAEKSLTDSGFDKAK